MMNSIKQRLVPGGPLQLRSAPLLRSNQTGLMVYWNASSTFNNTFMSQSICSDIPVTGTAIVVARRSDANSSLSERHPFKSGQFSDLDIECILHPEPSTLSEYTPTTQLPLLTPQQETGEQIVQHTEGSSRHNSIAYKSLDNNNTLPPIPTDMGNGIFTSEFSEPVNFSNGLFTPGFVNDNDDIEIIEKVSPKIDKKAEVEMEHCRVLKSCLKNYEKDVKQKVQPVVVPVIPDNRPNSPNINKCQTPEPSKKREREENNDDDAAAAEVYEDDWYKFQEDKEEDPLPKNHTLIRKGSPAYGFVLINGCKAEFSSDDDGDPNPPEKKERQTKKKKKIESTIVVADMSPAPDPAPAPAPAPDPAPRRRSSRVRKKTLKGKKNKDY